MNSEGHSREVESFYHLGEESASEILCRGMACFTARRLDGDRWQQACRQVPPVYCLGKCYLAPASSTEDATPTIEIHASRPVVLARMVEGEARSLKAYTDREGYLALEEALRESPDEIIRGLEVSGLRGRGGAAFPTGRKWRAVYEQKAQRKVIVANADEGDPGAYIDRFIMEDDPHCLIEAMAIAAYAVGAGRGYIYLRNEYPVAHSILSRAVADARSEGILGEHVLQSDFAFDVEIVLGRGSYICGEETALLNSLEGNRPVARPRPPYPTEHGLMGQPTLVNNIETLANVPWIIRNGAEAYRRLGFSSSRGTKVVSLNSLFQRPGLYEIEFGMPVRSIVDELGGGLTTGPIKGAIIGGPLAGIVPPWLFDTPFAFEELRAIGASIGHGGIVAFDNRTSIAELIHHVFEFGAFESCGRCTPCRLGSRRVEQIFSAVVSRGAVSPIERSEIDRIVSALAMTSLCGLGTGLAEFAQGAFRYYGKELEHDSRQDQQ
jgi:NADH:ubiquinone oxidoreductase subunit F (NADH-binding)